jgi:N-dimethylarginine dimethylaminohydrolase
MSLDLNEYRPLARVAVKHAADAFASDDAIARQWRDLHFTAPPDRLAAIAESDAFLALVASRGAVIERLPPGQGVGLDAIYARDAAIESPAGMILCHMGKPQRRGEPAAQAEAYRGWHIPIAGVIEAPGQIEGGDVVWFDRRTVAVGRGYRTNAEGIRQFRALAGPGVDVIEVPLPHWRGPGDVFHLMSVISPVDRDLAVVYPPLMTVPFLEWLAARGIGLVEVPEAEFDSMGANVLALASRVCVMVEGNPRTRALLERAGAEVLVYSGTEISIKGGGGPTCLTRPLARR